MSDTIIDTNFPGGNALVDEIVGDTVRLHPDLRDTQGNWFYWSFRVRGAAGRALTFQFTAQDPVGVRGPAVSLDEGRTWREDVLCRSRKGRDVPRLYVGNLAGAPRHRFFVTARHHCCEMMASYALEGLVAGMLEDDETGRWYRSCVEAVFLPFMDRDGVEDGDQGKNRQPRDHNRDYAGVGIYPETRAVREFAPRWSQGGPLVAIDLHCPWIRGSYNEQLYQVGRENPAIWAEQQRFGAALERVACGPLPYRLTDDLPFGKDWNVATGYTDGMSSSVWFGTLPNIRLATAFELPYANCSGQEVNAASARAFGRDLAEALRQYLQ